MADLQAHFDGILSAIGNARRGLTEPVFLFVSQLTPMVNVDLLIKNDAGQTLLTWRADQFYGPGWHVPGGVIRFKELAQERISAVANQELGASVQADDTPVCIKQVMAPNRDVRGHFISMLYHCRLLSLPETANQASSQESPSNGQWQWHDGCPSNIIAQHEMYREYMTPAQNQSRPQANTVSDDIAN